MHADRVRICIVTPIGLTAFLSYPYSDIFRAFPACIRWERVTESLDDSRNERRQIIFLPSLLNGRGGTKLLLSGFDLSYFLSYFCRHYKAVRGMSISARRYFRDSIHFRSNMFRDIICHFVRHRGRALSKAGTLRRGHSRYTTASVLYGSRRKTRESERSRHARQGATVCKRLSTPLSAGTFSETHLLSFE